MIGGRTMRRHVARLGILAVLVQAVLFGWHHHHLPPAWRGAQSALHAAAGAPLSPASTEDDCDICAALHHLTAAPGEFAAMLPALAIAAADFLPPAAIAGGIFHDGFRARAPPQA